MKSIILFITLQVLSVSSICEANLQNIWQCNSVTIDNVRKIQATVNLGLEAEILILRADNNKEIERISLPFESENYYAKDDGDCADQSHGGRSTIFYFNGENSKYITFWCDDDGGGGRNEYLMECKQ
ncbi:MAG: hypothetical protein A2622_00050 [Bdellovibrionales bacterium RIFCSPHIGHO2_01_FULL_40_29]|nr:MAG: hypothetical protein A2622_00050 [Bdellovibrionales bacterium RIFCSPHIGHO2_01_FULL_40_29]OFZ32519.1 MAG: hypothetical protein A3D17_04650 [Bdellovibrionales bacterium RIFCSPHIGHO2_02_FULL_40_15]